jgi:hypothetical protein
MRTAEPQAVSTLCLQDGRDVAAQGEVPACALGLNAKQLRKTVKTIAKALAKHRCGHRFTDLC